MPTKLVLIPNKMGSRGTKALAQVLTTKVGHKVFRMTAERVQQLRAKGRKRISFQLREGTDKLTQMRKFTDANVSCPDHTTDRSVATGWIADGGVVVCRTLLRSSEGKGIVVAEQADQVVQAPLYTKYVKKKKEFRVHVFNGQVIDVQEKRKKRSHEDQRDTRIRNVANGYVFCREGLVEPTGLRDLATSATTALGYSLGAVDIAYNERNDKLYVLEVNSCPGMQGTTLESYANAITTWYKEQR